MSLHRTGKAHRLAGSTLDSRPQRHLWARNFLRVPLAAVVLGLLQMTCGGTPIIGVKAGDPKGLQQSFQLEKNVALTPLQSVVWLLDL